MDALQAVAVGRLRDTMETTASQEVALIVCEVVGKRGEGQSHLSEFR